MEQTQSNKTITTAIVVILVLTGIIFFLWKAGSFRSLSRIWSGPTVGESFDKLFDEKRLDIPDPVRNDLVSNDKLPEEIRPLLVGVGSEYKVWQVEYSSGQSGYIVLYTSSEKVSEIYKQVLTAMNSRYTLLYQGQNDQAILIEAENSNYQVRISGGEKENGSKVSFVILNID